MLDLRKQDDDYKNEQELARQKLGYYPNGINDHFIRKTLKMGEYTQGGLKMESIHETLKERGTRYGEFRTHAKITQLLKGVVEQEQGYSRLSNSQREAMDMILHKIGRIINGDPSYMDSWVDICGYSQLVVDELRGEEEFQRMDVPAGNQIQIPTQASDYGYKAIKK